jgi:hypothetical protein
LSAITKRRARASAMTRRAAYAPVAWSASACATRTNASRNMPQPPSLLLAARPIAVVHGLPWPSAEEMVAAHVRAERAEAAMPRVPGGEHGLDLRLPGVARRFASRIGNILCRARIAWRGLAGAAELGDERRPQPVLQRAARQRDRAGELGERHVGVALTQPEHEVPVDVRVLHHVAERLVGQRVDPARLPKGSRRTPAAGTEAARPTYSPILRPERPRSVGAMRERRATSLDAS